jgi:hypothetical protein
MIDHVRHSEDADLCKQILAVMSTVYRPVAFDELPSVIELPDGISDDHEALSEIIAICGSFLTLRDDSIIFVHQSAKDFLLGQARSEIFPKGKEAGHHAILLRSLQVMFQTLRRNILQIGSPEVPIDKVRHPSRNPLAAAQYGCLYWVDHLQDSRWIENNDLCYKGGYLDVFLRQKYLHWLEALSILGNISQGISALFKLDGLLQVSDCST